MPHCSSGKLCAALQNCTSQLHHPAAGREHLDLLMTSGDSEDKRPQPHHFHITNDSLHFKGLLPTLAPAFSAQQGHWNCCPMLQGGSAGICYYCSCSLVLPLLQRGACRSFWSSCLTVGCRRRAQGCWYLPPVLCSGTIQRAAGHPSQQG